MKTLIKNATIINENKIFKGSVLIEDEIIKDIFESDNHLPEADNIIDASNKLLIPGVIDDQVHFREPGLTHKAEIETEARAAVAGGVTSFMEMPNTIPQSTTLEELEKKYDIASERSLANYSFYLGATNNNIEQIEAMDTSKICGVKVFMGSSTGNMLVDNPETLVKIFKKSPTLVATHCEDEDTIRKNMQLAKEKYGEDVPVWEHANIRSAKACLLSSEKAAKLARENNTRLHILHLSTKDELELLDRDMPLSKRKITGEVCVHHLWFTADDYKKYGSKIKWNPAVKAPEHREALRKALNDDVLAVVATDHAPHTKDEKNNTYFKAPSGGPLVQHSLVAMLEMVKQGVFTYQKVIEKMCHAPAELFNIVNRGYIRKGYKADLVLVEPDIKEQVTKDNIYYKCKWSPFEGNVFSHKVTHTFVNGHLAYCNNIFNEDKKGQRLIFEV